MMQDYDFKLTIDKSIVDTLRLLFNAKEIIDDGNDPEVKELLETSVELGLLKGRVGFQVRSCECPLSTYALTTIGRLVLFGQKPFMNGDNLVAGIKEAMKGLQ